MWIHLLFLNHFLMKQKVIIIMKSSFCAKIDLRKYGSRYSRRYEVKFVEDSL